ncbi:hypothetical protein F4810DRAFT_704475 [Camillea tinctor]|nr:hypothetical protein F4810DRAFT_704475 [Camillea tinctor]
MQSEILEIEKRLNDMHPITVRVYDIDFKDTANEALLLQSQIAQLRHLENGVLAAVEHYFERAHHFLRSKAETFLNHPRDLKEGARDGVNHFARCNEISISLTVNLVTILIAVVFLIGPILGLNFAPDPTAKLVMISLFTAFFAASIELITKAKRGEIFATTTAYAAVLVVFVGNDQLSSGQDN